MNYEYKVVYPKPEKKEEPIRFYHPNREMLRNQLGLFLIEFLIERPTLDIDIEPYIEKKIDEFLRIMDGKAGFM